MTNSSTSSIHHFLPLLAPKNAGDVFSFHLPTRTIERVGDLFQLTEDFILTGKIFILVPELILVFDKLWKTFVMAQRINGCWNVDPITFLATKDDALTLILRPTVVGLACLLVGCQKHPQLAQDIPPHAIDQAVQFISSKIKKEMENSNLFPKHQFWKFVTWMTRLLDRPTMLNSPSLRPLIQIIDHALEDSLTNADETDITKSEIESICEIHWRLKGTIPSNLMEMRNRYQKHETVIDILNNQAINKQVLASPDISAEDILWLPFWKLRLSCDSSDVLEAHERKLEPLKQEELKSLHLLLLKHQLSRLRALDE